MRSVCLGMRSMFNCEGKKRECVRQTGALPKLSGLCNTRPGLAGVDDTDGPDCLSVRQKHTGTAPIQVQRDFREAVPAALSQGSGPPFQIRVQRNSQPRRPIAQRDGDRHPSAGACHIRSRPAADIHENYGFRMCLPSSNCLWQALQLSSMDFHAESAAVKSFAAAAL